jgi:hypothetical protein
VDLFGEVPGPAGGVDAGLLSEGLLGRGQIVDVQQTGATGDADHSPQRECVFTVRVFLDDVEPFEACCRQAVPAALLPALASGQRPVAVRVDGDDHAQIALDLSAEPPTVRLPASAPSGSASEIIATGRTARVEILHSAPTGLRSAAGVDLHSFVLTVSLEGQAPYQCQTTQPVPPDAVALISPGATLPAFVATNNDGAVAIHWDAGLAATSQPAGS